jgi:hypothetical protein
MNMFTRNILPVVFAAILILASCSGRKNKAVHKNIIPEKDLISILTDVYLADGLLTLPGVRFIYARGDSLSSYIDIIENYGYTKSQMDRTMRFYFVRRPKRLVKIYDKALGRLSELESLVTNELPAIRAGELNIWPGKTSYYSPSQPDENPGWIDHIIDKYGKYHLKFTITIFPDDQSVNPHLGLSLSHSDTTGIEKIVEFTTIPFIKDGNPHTYKMSLIPDLDHPVRLMGWFIDNEGSAPWLEQHYRVENIILSPYIIQE